MQTGPAETGAARLEFTNNLSHSCDECDHWSIHETCGLESADGAGTAFDAWCDEFTPVHPSKI